jgi:DNA-binding GntR family transcriptional regulator
VSDPAPSADRTGVGHEHEGLLRAIAGGEAERARAIVAEHIDTFEREIRTVL